MLAKHRTFKTKLKSLLVTKIINRYMRLVEIYRGRETMNMLTEYCKVSEFLDARDICCNLPKFNKEAKP